MKVYCFRMSETTLMKGKKGPPRPGLIPVRVFVSGGKVRAHTKLVYKKPGEDGTHELEYVGPDHERDKLHTVGSGENERSYPAIIYIREGDLEKFLNPNEQKRLDARIHAETLLANLGHADHDMAALRSEISEVQKEIREEQVVAKRVGKPTKTLDKLKAQAADLVESLKAMEAHYDEVLEDYGDVGKKKRRLRAKVGKDSVDGLGLKLSPAAIAKIDRRVEKIAQSIPPDLSEDDLRKIINQRIEEDAKFATQPNRMFGFLKDKNLDSPGPNESEDAFKSRWSETRQAIRRIITWHMKNTMADMYTDTFGTVIEVPEHPFSDTVKTGPTLPETARGEAFAITRAVASGKFLIPVTQHRSKTSTGRTRVTNKVDPSMFGHTKGKKRYLTKQEFDTLVSELMGVRMAIFDEHGNAIPSAVKLPEGDIRSTIAKKMWLGGFMDTIVPIARHTLKDVGVTQREFERVIGAAMTGLMDALVSYAPDLGKKNYAKDYSIDPTLALMNHVLNKASDHAENEAVNIKGELEGDDKLASLRIEQYTAGSFGRLKKFSLVMADTQRRLAAQGIFEEPTTVDLMETAETMQGQFMEYVPATVREKDPDAVMKWIKEQLTKGLELDVFDESHTGDDEDAPERSKRMPVGKMFSDARQWYNLQYRGGPRTSGQVGSPDIQVRTYERNADGSLRRGFRDHFTGRIKDDPKGPPILREEWVRNSDGTFKRELLRDHEGAPVLVDKETLTRLDVYRDKHGTYRRKNGDKVTHIEPDAVKYEEGKSGKLRVLDTLVPNRRAHHTFLGGSIVTPLQMEKLEIGAHIRRELFYDLGKRRGSQKYVLTAEDARVIDLLYFRGLPLDPYQEYHDEHDKVQDAEADLKKYKGLVDPIKINKTYLKDNRAAIEAWTGKTAKVGGTITPFEVSIGQALLRMREEGSPESAIDNHRIKAENKKRALKKKLAAAKEKYEATKPSVFYPDAAPASMATEGMLNFPGVPVDAEGSPNRKLLAQYLGPEIVSKLGKNADYDAALHIALRRELAEPKYGRTTSIFKPEVLDNPDLRRAARIFFETGELPAEVSVMRRPGTSREYEERISPRKHGLRTRTARDGTKVLERTKTEFIFPAKIAKQQPGERQPLVYDHTMVDEDGRKGKEVPMYSVINDEMVEVALADVQRIKDLIRTRGYFDKDNPTLPIVKELQEDAPELFVSGPPLGQSKYVIAEEIQPSGEIRYVTHKQEFTRKEAKRLAENVKKHKERVKALKGKAKEQAQKALAKAQAKYREVTSYLDWKDRTQAAWRQRVRDFRHGITDQPREPRGGTARSRQVETPVFNEKSRRALKKYSEQLKAGKDPRGVELEKWMNRTYGQDKDDLKQISQLQAELAKTKSKRRIKAIKGKLAVLEARTFDAVKVNSAMLEGLVQGSRFGGEYAKFLADLNISTEAVFDSHSILMYESDVAFKQAMAAKEPAFDPSGHHEVIASAEMHHPLLKFLSTDQVLSVIRAIQGSQNREAAYLSSGRGEVRKVLQAVHSKALAYARDEDGKVIRDKNGEPVLRDDVFTVTRKKRGKVTARGARYHGITGDSGKTYDAHFTEVSRVLPKTGRPRVSEPTIVDHKVGKQTVQTVVYKTPKEQVVKVTQPKQPPLPPSLHGEPEAEYRPREHHSAMRGDVAGSVTLKPPSGIPAEAPPQSMAHQKGVAGFSKRPTEMGRALPPVKTKKAPSGAVAVAVDKPSADEVKPMDPVTAKTIAREWSAHQRMGIPTKPKYKPPKGDEPVHTPILPTEEHITETRQAYLRARAALIRELKSQHRIKSDGKTIPRSRKVVLDRLQKEHSEALRAYRGSLPSDETRQRKKVAESPSYKHPDVKTAAGKQKFAFSQTTHVFGAVSAPPRGTHVVRTI